VGVAEADRQRLSPAPLKELPPLSMQIDVRFARFLAAYFHVEPAQFPRDAGSKRLGHRFLGGKASGHKRRGIAVLLAVNNFVRAQDALKEPIPEFLQGMTDTFHFNKVDAEAEDHGGRGGGN